MKIWNVTVGLLVCVLAGNGAALAQAAHGPMSEANRVLFVSDQLANIHRPGILYYRLDSAGTKEQSFTDRVKLIVRSVAPDGTKNIEFDFLSGERHRFVPQITQATGNPILTVFLQRDVVDMQRHTGGSWRYFQRAIKFAFADSAVVKPVKFEFNHKQVAGTEVLIIPYHGDQHIKEMGDYANKRYRFVLSDAVPGGVYRIETVVPTAKDGPPLRAETLTFDHAEALANGNGVSQ